MWVSPNYQDTDFLWPLCLDDKITIFLDRTMGWQLEIADLCINGKKGTGDKYIIQPIPHSGFAVLNIVLSYFEMIAKYQDGFTRNTKSEYYFKRGLYSVFPQLKEESAHLVDNLLNVLYFGCRCGLYHCGMTDQSVVIGADTCFPLVFAHKEQKLKINPHLLIPALKKHLNHYGTQLRDIKNVVLRKNFEKRFDYEALNGIVSGDTSFCGKKGALADLLENNQRVVFCGINGMPTSSGGYYSDPRNRFWTVLYRIGLVPQVFSSGECKRLIEYGIGLTMLNPVNQSKNQNSLKYNVAELKNKIERYAPLVLAFNGKRAAQEFFGNPVHYGRQQDLLGSTTVFVLPSTSGIARKYWNELFWREMAKFVKEQGF